jgi:AraC-like DNA-binding protein
METAAQDLGLRALRLVEAGGCEVIEYLAASSASWGEALEIITRYARLLSDSVDYRLHEHAQRAVFELESRTRLSRPLADFHVGLIALAARSWLPQTNGFEFWFSHERPLDTRPYERIFGAATLRFSAPCNAVLFDKDTLRVALRDSNPKLHTVLRRHAERLLADIPPIDMLTGRVRELVLQLLPAGKSDVRHAAERLNMSRRTLARRLKTEGASYREVVEDARYALARRYLAMPTLDVKEIAFLLGYSETAAFSRAFRRWSGHSPLQYRESLVRGQRVSAPSAKVC